MNTQDPLELSLKHVGQMMKKKRKKKIKQEEKQFNIEETYGNIEDMYNLIKKTRKLNGDYLGYNTRKISKKKYFIKQDSKSTSIVMLLTTNISIEN